MDRTAIIVIAACVALLVLMNRLVPKAFPPKPLPPGATNVVNRATTQTGTNAATTAPAITAATNAPQFIVNTNAPEQLIVISNDTARYTFTSRGGGLKLVELVKYRESVPSHLAKQTDTNRVATLNGQTTVPTLALLDGESVQGDGIFSLTPTTGGIRAEKSLPNGLTIVKDFQLGTNYLFMATVRLENRGTQPLMLPSQEWVVGTATLLGPQDPGVVLGLMWYDGQRTANADSSYFKSGFSCVPRTPHTEYRAGNSNVVWAAAQNQFFALTAMPQEAAAQVVARAVSLPRWPEEEPITQTRSNPPPQGVQTALVYPALTLAPNGAVERKINFFAGPKEYRTLARIADRFQNKIDLVMGFGWFGFFSKALLLAMNWLHHTLMLPYAWTIVAITVIIKLLFWPLTTASTRSMKRMQALAPELKALQEKYKDEPQKLQQKQWELYRKNKVNPVSGCLPMLIQMPVFFGFFGMIRTAIELRGAAFLWVADLSNPDTVYIIHGLGIPFIGIPGVGLPVNLLPLVMGATMLWQSHLTPTSPGVDPMQQKMMRYLPLIFLFGLYNYSAGMTLYWTVNNLLTIAQMKLTKTQPATAAPATPASVSPAPKKKK